MHLLSRFLNYYGILLQNWRKNRGVFFINFILCNGLNLFYKELVGTHSMSFDLFVKTGVRYESKKENGISNFLGNLHYRYIHGYDQEHLFNKIESIGSNMQIYTYKDFMKISMKVHPRYYEVCVDLLKNLIETFDWDEELFQKEKKTILKQIEGENQYEDIEEISSKNYHYGSPLALPIKGSYNTVNNLTLEQISNFKKVFFNKSGTALFFSGPIEKRNIDYITERFSNVLLSDNTMRSPKIIPRDFCKRLQNFFWCFNECDYINVNISFDVSISEKEYFCLDILNSILGEGIGSKLQIVLREHVSLVFDIRSVIEKYDTFSILHIQYSVNKKDFKLVFDTVLNVLVEMKKRISESEIETSLPFYKENLDFLLDDPQKYNFYYAYNTFILGHSLENEYVVSPSDIMLLSQKIFLPDNIVVTCTGDDSEINKKELQDMLIRLRVTQATE